MPEMADIEVLKRRFNEELKGQTVTAVKILNPALVKVTELDMKLTGKKILESRRYGKYLFTKIDASGWLVFHFGLTGHITFEKDPEKKLPASAMLVISLSNLQLIYTASHVFGAVSWCETPEDFIGEKKLGPDAGAVSEEEFFEIMRPLKGAVKPSLMDQHKLAGVGNVYADEILFQAGIHPQVPVKSLTEGSLKEIYKQLHRVHTEAVKVDAVRTNMPDWSLLRIRKTSRKCPKCSGELKMIPVNNRETLFCPYCQKLKSF